MALDKILDRVRKLLALADNAGSEEEAATAATRAAEMMEEYALTEALARLDTPNRPPEAIVNESLIDGTKKNRVAWKEAITFAVANDLGIHTYFHRVSNETTGYRTVHTTCGIGRESAIQTWNYTCQFLWNMVEELCNVAWATEGTGHGKAWKNAFKIGCAYRIAARLVEAKDARVAARVATVKAAAGDKSSLALQVIQKDQDEVDAAYAEHAKGFGRPSKAIGQVSNRGGYEAGREAGDKISLGGKRAGLTSGQGRLTE